MKYWAILPAAGIGRRMGSTTPKQYLPLNGVPVIAHSLQKISRLSCLGKIVVVLHPADVWWEHLALAEDGRITTVYGGAERFQSVLNGLKSLSLLASDEDWVLVHDAVRPCVRVDDMNKLIDQLTLHPVGGLLGVSVVDTLKRTDADGAVQETVDRSQYWQAQTPQMFRYGMLLDALQQLIASAAAVTDEAAAIERLGHKPQMGAGHKDNIKITHESDLDIASPNLLPQATQGEACQRIICELVTAWMCIVSALPSTPTSH